MEKVSDNWPNSIFELAIGSNNRTLRVGGQNVLPFIKSDGKIPNLPGICLEVWDLPPESEWPFFNDSFKEITADPVEWCKKADEWGADAVCLKLVSCHPDKKNNSGNYAANLVKTILNTIELPLVVIGCGDIERDTDILSQISNESKGANLLLGMAVKENYRTIVAAAQAGGHSIIAESPLDINLAKQLNILISDSGMPLDRIVMHHTTGGLGYGFEYCYSIMERCRLAGLQGDKTMAMPTINIIGSETWITKEAKATIEEQPEWGDIGKRAVAWEVSCAAAYIQAGSDLLVLAHPESIKSVNKLIDTFR